MKRPRLLEIKEVPLTVIAPPGDEKIIYAYVPKKKEEVVED